MPKKQTSAPSICPVTISKNTDGVCSAIVTVLCALPKMYPKYLANIFPENCLFMLRVSELLLLNKSRAINNSNSTNLNSIDCSDCHDASLGYATLYN